MAQKSQRDRIYELANAKAELMTHMKMFDKNKDGKISAAELGKKCKDEKLKALIMSMDKDKNGEVTMKEMWTTMKKGEQTTKEEQMLINDAAENAMKVERFFKFLSGKKDTISLIDAQTKQRNVKVKPGEENSLGNVQNIFGRIDKDGSAELTFDELWGFFFDIYFPDIETELKMIRFFNAADKNGSGDLDKTEIFEALKSVGGTGQTMAQEVLAEIRAGEDNVILISEFIKQWKMMVREKKFPSTCKRGLQHSEEELIQFAAERADLKLKHLKLEDARKKAGGELNNLLGCLAAEDANFDDQWDAYRQEKGIELTLEENQVVTAMSDQVASLKLFFTFTDADGSGTLGMGECYNKYGVDPENQSLELQNIVNNFARIDNWGDGKVTFEELLAFYRPIVFPQIGKEVEMLKFFHDIDEDGNGVITHNEGQKVMSKCCPSDEHAVFETAVAWGYARDGSISIPDFMETWKYMLKEEMFPKKR